ncbi:MAG: hypothetical protein RR726_36830, partial [Pseudomonas sp.]
PCNVVPGAQVPRAVRLSSLCYLIELSLIPVMRDDASDGRITRSTTSVIARGHGTGEEQLS